MRGTSGASLAAGSSEPATGTNSSRRALRNPAAPPVASPHPTFALPCFLPPFSPAPLAPPRRSVLDFAEFKSMCTMQPNVLRPLTLNVSEMIAAAGDA